VLTACEVTGVEPRGSTRVVKLNTGADLAAHTVILATGVSYRMLQAPGCEDLTGRGIYYGGAATEGTNCAGKEVYIVGAANSAGQAAMYFSRYASTVHLVVRGNGLEASMSAYLIEQVRGASNIEVHTCTEVIGAVGDEHLERLTLLHAPSGQERIVDASWMFVFIGAAPRTDWLEGVVERDARGFVLTGPDLVADGRRPRGWDLERDPYHLDSSVPGVFVAGDVRADSVKRVASAVGEGAMAVTLVHRYLESQ
jgi:thioredoxin reductase (NADPH)